MSRFTQRCFYVGLGNPGKNYEMTRHNIGEIIVRAFAQKTGIPLKEEKHFIGFTGRQVCEDVDVHLLVPTTYMNESGRAVRLYLDYYKLKPSELVVVADDTDHAFGRLRLKSFGGPGGHNGLRSVENYLGTREYPRLRVGIGHKPPQQILADYVLGRFNAEEVAKLPAIVEQGTHVLQRLLKEKIAIVMNAVNAISIQENKNEPQEPKSL